MDRKKDYGLLNKNPEKWPERGIIVFDRDLRIWKIDAIASNLLGGNPTNYLKKKLDECFSNEVFSEIIHTSKEVIKGEINERFISITREGNLYNFQVISFKPDPNKSPLLGLILLDDYNGRKDDLYELSGLRRISRALSSVVFNEGFYRIFIRKAMEFLNTEAGTIALLEPGEEGADDVIFKYALGEKADLLEGISIKSDVGIIGWVISNNKSVITNEARNDPRFFPWVDYLTGFVTRSIVCVPIRVSGDAVGAIEVINNRSKGFDIIDIERLKLFCRIISERIEGNYAWNGLKKNYEFLSGIIDTIGEGIVIVDRDLRVKFVNQSLSMLLNKEKEHIIGGNFHNIFQRQEHGLKIEGLLRYLFSSGQGFSTEYELKRDSEGDRRFIRINADPLEMDDEVVSTALISFCDVTHLKRLELFLEAGAAIASSFTGIDDFNQVAEEGLEIIGRAMSADSVFWYEAKSYGKVDRNLFIRAHWNRNQNGNFKFEEDDIKRLFSNVEKDLIERKILFNTRNSVSEPLRGILHSLGIDSMILIPIHLKDTISGIIRIDNPDIDSYLSPEEINFLHTVSDLFSKVVAQESYLKKINESELRYREIYDNLNDIWYLHDMEGRIFEINRAGEKITGYDREELLNMKISDLIAARYRHLFDEYMKEIREKGRTEGYMRIVTKDGIEKILDYKNWVVSLHNGKTAVRGLVRDVTEKMKVRHQFKHAQRMESIGILASGISHNFKNILSGIMTQSQLIQEKYRSYPELQRYTNEIIKLTKEGNKLISDLLGFSWKGGKDDRELLNLSEVIDTAFNILSYSIKDDIKIVKDWPEQLMLYGNRTSLLQVIINLCTNARDAMPEGGTLKITAKRENSNIVLVVEDTGCGMDDNVKSKIFDPFFTTKERGKGTGLGLYTIYKIVKEHEGEIEVESVPGKGSVFKVYLPASDITIKQEDRGVSLKVDGKKVLFVDDDINTLVSMKDLLTLRGYHVDYCFSGREAIEKFFSFKPDIMVIDREMPGMDGMETIKKIFSRDSEAKIILISGYEDSGVNGISDEIREIIRGYMTKPIDINKLCSMLETM